MATVCTQTANRCSHMQVHITAMSDAWQIMFYPFEFWGGKFQIKTIHLFFFNWGFWAPLSTWLLKLNGSSCWI